MKYAKLVVLLCLIFSLANAASAQNHILTLRETDGIERTNYPLRFAQPFLQGEIPDFPQVVLDGELVSTQSNVLQRWEDGSVRHAVLTLLVPSLPANATRSITFTNQIGGQTEGPLMHSQMLEARFNFEALFSLTSDGNTQTASARQMLNDNIGLYWCEGSIATEVIIADHSVDRAYDLGWDTHRSFRPIIHATFWDQLNLVEIRFIGENANTEALQDLTYDLELSVGQSEPEVVYQRDGMLHHAASRWTVNATLGGELGGVELDPGLAYLARTKLLPNYDTDLHPSDGALQTAYNTWTASDHDLFGAGNWAKYMPGTGGRPDIGLYPTWVVQYLYTGDGRLREKAFGHADLAAAWPMHFREGDPTKFYDTDGTIPALGKPISIKARPTVFLFRFVQNYDDSGGTSEDIISAVGPLTNGNEDVYSGWFPDQAHQPDPFTALYLVTGDYFLLEEAQFWASYTAARGSYGDNSVWSRSINGTLGGLAGEIRGQAWAFRSRVHTASITPDEGPERAYYDGLIVDAIAMWEGLHDIGEEAAYPDHEMYSWGQSLRPTYGNVLYVDPPIQMSFPSPLHQWAVGHRIMAQQGAMNQDSVLVGNSPWEQNFMTLALGRAEELGYPTAGLRAWLGQRLIDQLTTPGYNPYFLADYREPGVRHDTTWYADWAEASHGYRTDIDYETQWNNYLSDAQHGYTNIARAAMSTIVDLPDGVAAWQFIEEHGSVHPALEDNPKWALLPRGEEIHAPFPPTLLSPANGGWDTLPSIELSWRLNGDPDPGGIPCSDVWVDTLPDMSTARLVADSTENTLFTLENLTEGQMIYWRIRATDTNSPGTWSDIWSFLPIDLDAPSEVDPLFPRDEMDIEDVFFPIRFRWTHSTDPDPLDTLHYQLVINEIGEPVPVLSHDTSDTTALVDDLELGDYTWYVITTDRYAQFSRSDTLSFRVILETSTDESGILPTEYALHHPVPNPFNAMSRIRFDLPEPSDVVIRLHDILGREVRTLLQNNLAAGRYTLALSGDGLASGVYFLSFQHGKQRHMRKVVLMK